MFSRKICLRLYETDATGVLYFPQQLRMAQETFECFLESVDSSLGGWLAQKSYLFPVVHAEADYCKPLCVGQEIEIRLSLEKIGVSSFTLSTLFVLPGEVVAGKTTIVHVAIDRASWQSCPVPEEVKKSLTKLQEMANVY